MSSRPLLCMVMTLCACTPTLDWREVHPEGSGAQVLFPCKPSTQVRMVALAGVPMRMAMATCQADGATFALTFADANDPLRTIASLAAMRDALSANLGAAPRVVGAAQVRGMTPNPAAQRLRVDGKGPDDVALTQESVFFTRGTWVYQATVMAPKFNVDAADTFFDSLELPG